MSRVENSLSWRVGALARWRCGHGLGEVALEGALPGELFVRTDGVKVSIGVSGPTAPPRALAASSAVTASRPFLVAAAQAGKGELGGVVDDAADLPRAAAEDLKALRSRLSRRSWSAETCRAPDSRAGLQELLLPRPDRRLADALTARSLRRAQFSAHDGQYDGIFDGLATRTPPRGTRLVYARSEQARSCEK